MNRVIVPIFLAIGFLGSAGIGEARAAILTSPPPTVSGPGGSGTAVVDPLDANTLDVVKAFVTGPGYLDVTFTVDGADSYSLNELILNGSGRRWDGFRFDIIAAPAGSGFSSEASTAFPDTTPNNGPPVTSFTFSGGLVRNGNAFGAEIGLSITDAGEIIVRQTPLIAAPEPSTLALGVVGVAVALGYGRLRRGRPGVRGTA